MLADRRILLVASIAGATAGCTLELDNRTEPTLSHRAQQRFAADVTARGWQVQGVEVLLPGRYPLQPGPSARRWEGDVGVTRCAEAIPFRFAVQYRNPDDLGEPQRERIFPGTGTFLTRVVDVPSRCDSQAMTVSQRFVVTGLEDLPDAQPGDGICAVRRPPRPGPCTLRAAVMEANARPGLDLIVLSPSPIVLTRRSPRPEEAADASVGDLDVTDDLAIDGADAANGCAMSVMAFLKPVRDPDPMSAIPGSLTISKIDGGGIDRVLEVHPGSAGKPPVQLALRCLHVLNGQLLGRDHAEGANILNRGTLVLERVAVTDGVFSAMGIPGTSRTSHGAGISNRGRLAMRESALASNDGDPSGAGFSGTEGGGLYNAPGALADIEQSLIAFNTGSRGYGIWNAAENGSDGTLNLFNSTVHDNLGIPVATNWRDSDVVNIGRMTIYWSSLTKVQEYVTTLQPWRVLASPPGSSLLIAKSIISTSVQPTCAENAIQGITSLGGNWTSFRASCFPRPQATDHAVGVRGLRGELHDLGGFTPVADLTAPYPDEDPNEPRAMDAGEQAFPLCPRVDQRGFLRPADGNGDGRIACDAGAHELNAVPPGS